MSEVTLYNGDCLEVMPTLDDNSIDLIITDPPYPAEFSYLWEPLAKEAARTLKVGGSLITLCGHYQIPYVTATFAPHLRFWWSLVMFHSGTKHRLAGKWVTVRHKPALWYVKERRRTKDRNCPLDVVPTGGTRMVQESKRLHKWGQGAGWFAHYIEELTDANDVVMDPFMGSGTTGVVCVNTNRSFIGIEKELIDYTNSKRRVEEAQNKARQLEMAI